MNKDIVVLGNGWIGQKITEYFNCDYSDYRIIQPVDLIDALGSDEPKVIINAIGRNGKESISWCENHKAETYLSNVHVPYSIAEHCREYGIKLVHISTCYIAYDNSFYTKTKSMAEDILSEYKNVLITRINLPIDSVPHPRNLLTKLLHYKTITNARSSVTILDSYLQALEKLIKLDAKGTFNCVNGGTISPWKIIELYEQVTGKRTGKIYKEENQEHFIRPDIDMGSVEDKILRQIQEYVKRV